MQHIQPNPLAWRIRLGILLPLLAMGALPLIVYFQHAQRDLLLAMLMVLATVQILLSLRTAGIAAGMMARLQRMSGNWDLLALSGVRARSLPLYVWLTTLRHTWIDHALLAIPRLGMALGLVQFFHIRGSLRLSIFSDYPFTYLSHNHSLYMPNFCYDCLAPDLLIYPDAMQVVITLIILVIYTVSEGALVAALGTFWGALRARHQTLAVSTAISSRLLLFGIVMISFNALGKTTLEYRSGRGIFALGNARNDVELCQFANRPQRDSQTLFRSQALDMRASGRCFEANLDLAFVRAVEAVQVTMTSFVDQGVLLSANLMRPIGPVSVVGARYFGHYLDDEWNWQTSYWPFLLRNVVSALLAFGIYGVLIGVVLLTASYRFVRYRLDW